MEILTQSACDTPIVRHKAPRGSKSTPSGEKQPLKVGRGEKASEGAGKGAAKGGAAKSARAGAAKRAAPSSASADPPRKRLGAKSAPVTSAA
jgi:hypothetical protein